MPQLAEGSVSPLTVAALTNERRIGSASSPPLQQIDQRVCMVGERQTISQLKRAIQSQDFDFDRCEQSVGIMWHSTEAAASLVPNAVFDHQVHVLQ